MGEFREFIEGLEARYNTAHAQTGTPAMINPGGTFSDAPEPEGALRIWLPVEWRAALVRDGAPEIPVTPAMYRAMAALAPGIEGKGEAERATAEVSDAYRYLRNIFEHVAPQCTPLGGLMGICTQIDNALAGAREEARASGNRAYIAEGRVRELEADLAAARAMLREWPATHDRHMALATAHVSKLTDQNSALGATNKRLRDEISAVTVENAALHDALALRPAVTTPKPSGHDPFREFPGDRRRMGLA